MRKKQRELESRQQALDREVARKVDEEREKIRRDAATVAVEEQRAFAKIWARREKQIAQVITNMALMYGGIQGIVGQSTLPEIECLELPEGDDISSTRG